MLVTLSFARESATSFAVPTVQGPGGTKPVKASRNDRTKGDRCQPDTSAMCALQGGAQFKLKPLPSLPGVVRHHSVAAVLATPQFRV